MNSDISDIRRALWELLLDLKAGEVATDDAAEAMISALDSLIDLAKLESALEGALSVNERQGQRSSQGEVRQEVQGVGGSCEM
jgi:hypothetical protein